MFTRSVSIATSRPYLTPQSISSVTQCAIIYIYAHTYMYINVFYMFIYIYIHIYIMQGFLDMPNPLQASDSRSEAVPRFFV
jgi:hypothetical protein